MHEGTKCMFIVHANLLPKIKNDEFQIKISSAQSILDNWLPCIMTSTTS